MPLTTEESGAKSVEPEADTGIPAAPETEVVAEPETETTGEPEAPIAPEG